MVDLSRPSFPAQALRGMAVRLQAAAIYWPRVVADPAGLASVGPTGCPLITACTRERITVASRPAVWGTMVDCTRGGRILLAEGEGTVAAAVLPGWGGGCLPLRSLF